MNNTEQGVPLSIKVSHFLNISPKGDADDDDDEEEGAASDASWEDVEREEVIG